MKESDITICGHGSGVPTTKKLDAYCTTRYNSKAPNGKHKGVIKVMRLKALDEAGRKKFHDTYKTILGRNAYSQPLRQYVYTPYKEKYKQPMYYSDCSSSVCATFKKIGYTNVGLLNTAGIYQSPLFEEVKVEIKNGHITNPEILKVGDCLLFVGSDPSRPLQIGHIEAVFEIKTTTTTKKEDAKVETKPSTTTSKVNYYPKYTGATISLVDALNSLKIVSTKTNRTKIAKANGITNYTGTVTQNNKLLSLLKAGKLIKA